MSEEKKGPLPLHFDGKEAVDHVIEAQVEGIVARSEPHGAEMPGPLFAAADSAKSTAVAILLLSLIFSPFNLTTYETLVYLVSFSFGWVLWVTGRSAWLGWSRLERLHRIMAEEKWEIEHHRSQEREELGALYQAKGFEGKLLEDVLDVLMADSNRTLKVMLEEELGLSLEKQEHPIKQGLGAALGAAIGFVICGVTFFFHPEYDCLIGALIVVGAAAGFSAKYQRNRAVPAMVWNLGLCILAYAGAFFLSQLIKY